MRLRPATAKDVGEIERLLVAASLPTVGVSGLIPSFVVAEGDRSLVGAAAVESCAGEVGLLRSVVVLPDQQHHGVGRRLVEWSIANSRRRGLKALYLLTTTAENYFPRFGFTPVARGAVPAGVQATEEFREACPASAAVMTLPLS